MTKESYAAIQVLLDEALRLAHREGHSWVRNEHVALVIARNHSHLLDDLPEELAAAYDELSLAQTLKTFPREFKRPHITGDMRQLFAAADDDDEPNPMQKFCELIAYEVLREVSQDEGAPRVREVATPHAAGAAPVEPGSTPQPQPTEADSTAVIFERDSVVDAIFTAFAMKHKRSVLIVGREGAGRSAIVDAIAQRISDAPKGSRIGGYSLHGLDLRSGAPGQARKSLQSAVAESHAQDILFIDNLETGASLEGLRQIDMEVLEEIERVTQLPDRNLVFTLDEGYHHILAQVPSLYEQFEVISLPELSTEALRAIAEHHAEVLGRYHNTTIGSEIIDEVIAPKRPDERSAHPTLALYRMDRIAARQALFGEQGEASAPFGKNGAQHFDADSVAAKMREEIQGQDRAIERVIDRLRVTRVNLDSRPHRPDGVFLLAGPTGVGKTAFALSLARHLCGDEDAVIRLDMSEFAERHTVSKLIGSPPGYVGSDEPSQWLTTKILERSNVVLLLDEIEKADPSVWQTFLQVFDAGRLTDSRGATADFRETVILLTSNMGATTFADRGSVGFGDGAVQTSAAEDAAVMRAIRERMTPELINRFDDILVFRPLTSEAVEAIALRELKALQKRLAERGIEVEFDESALAELVTRGYSREYGARPMLRLIDSEVLPPLSRLSSGKYRMTADSDTESGFAVHSA